MDKFLDNLYSYDNFGLYLIIAIVILIILFIVILFFGKKDKKNRELEETRRLEKLNADMFAKENSVEKTEENIVEKVEENPTLNAEVEQTVPQVEPVLTDNANVVEEPKIEENKEVVVDEPILQKEEEKPLIVEEASIPEYNFDEIANRVKALQSEEENLAEKVEEKPVLTAAPIEPVQPTESTPEIVEEVNPVVEDIPVVEEPVKPESITPEPVVPISEEIPQPQKIEVERGPQIFSSVYVPEKEEPAKESVQPAEPVEEPVEEAKVTPEPIEEVKPVIEETPNEEVVVNNDEVIDEDEFELPTLKKDDKEPVQTEQKPLSSVDLDSIAADSYNLNK